MSRDLRVPQVQSPPGGALAGHRASLGGGGRGQGIGQSVVACASAIRWTTAAASSTPTPSASSRRSTSSPLSARGSHSSQMTVATGGGGAQQPETMAHAHGISPSWHPQSLSLSHPSQQAVGRRDACFPRGTSGTLRPLEGPCPRICQGHRAAHRRRSATTDWAGESIHSHIGIKVICTLPAKFSVLFKVLNRIDGCLYAVKRGMKQLHKDMERGKQ